MLLHLAQHMTQNALTALISLIAAE
jgi:hypothetical protein